MENQAAEDPAASCMSEGRGEDREGRSYANMRRYPHELSITRREMSLTNRKQFKKFFYYFVFTCLSLLHFGQSLYDIILLYFAFHNALHASLCKRHARSAQYFFVLSVIRFRKVIISRQEYFACH